MSNLISLHSNALSSDPGGWESLITLLELPRGYLKLLKISYGIM